MRGDRCAEGEFAPRAAGAARADFARALPTCACVRRGRVSVRPSPRPGGVRATRLCALPLRAHRPRVAPSVCPSRGPFVRLRAARLSVRPSVRLSVRPFASGSALLSVCPPFCPYVRPSVRVSALLPIHPSVLLSVCPSLPPLPAPPAHPLRLSLSLCLSPSVRPSVRPSAPFPSRGLFQPMGPRCGAERSGVRDRERRRRRRRRSGAEPGRGGAGRGGTGSRR